MAEITAALVKELRDRTGAGMMDCKKALAENNGDIEASIDWLRTKGLAAAAKKAGRVAAEGLVGVAADGTKGAVVEVNSETDFVAKNEQFQAFVRDVTQVALAEGITDIETLAAAGYPTGGTVAEQLTNNIATIGENQSLRRAAILSVNSGVVTGYVHNAAAPGMGKIGVLVALESTAGADVLEPLAKQLAMHVAAANPLALNGDDRSRRRGGQGCRRDDHADRLHPLPARRRHREGRERLRRRSRRRRGRLKEEPDCCAWGAAVRLAMARTLSRVRAIRILRVCKRFPPTWHCPA